MNFSQYKINLPLIEFNYESFVKNNYHYIIGILLYFYYILISFIYYAPSTFACLQMSNLNNLIVYILINFILILELGCSLIANYLPPPLKEFYDTYYLSILTITICFAFCYYFILFIKCKDRVCIECDDNDRMRYNNYVLHELESSSDIRKIFTFYKKIANLSRLPISKCQIYSVIANNNNNNNICNMKTLNNDKTLFCNENIDPNIGAPILSEFYIMSANNVCAITNQHNSYMSDRMIDILLTIGVRCFDFHVFPLNYNRESIPVVGNFHPQTYRNLQNNYVPLDKCFRRIIKHYYQNNIHIQTNTLDPLFIHLNIYDSYNNSMQMKISELIQKYFQQSIGNLLLDSIYNYQNYEEYPLSKVPLCKLFGKVIIMIHLVGKNSQITTTLGEYCNFLSQNNLLDKEWLVMNNNYNPVIRQNHLRTNMAIIRNSNDLKTKYINNIDWTVPMSIGCQMVAMNFHYLDQQLINYLNFFQNSSFILKPKLLRRLDTLYTNVVQTDKSSSEKVSFEHISDNPKINNIYKKTLENNELIQLHKKDIQDTNDTVIDEMAQVKQQQMFY